MKKTLILLLVGIALIAASFFIGRWTKPDKSVPPQIIEVRIDSVSHFNVSPIKIEPVKSITAYLPVVLPDDKEYDEPMDTIDPYWQPPVDSVKVEIPISRYVAQKDSLYRVVAEGYAVDFKEITVYPKTVTTTNTIEVKKHTRWGIGVQAGYGATLDNNTVRLSPYIGVGISYNIFSF